MSTITTHPQPTVPPRSTRRVVRAIQAAVAVLAVTIAVVLVVGSADQPEQASPPASVDAETASARLLASGYLTAEEIREYEVTRDLQRRGLVPGVGSATSIPSAGGTATDVDRGVDLHLVR